MIQNIIGGINLCMILQWSTYWYRMIDTGSVHHICRPVFWNMNIIVLWWPGPLFGPNHSQHAAPIKFLTELYCTHQSVPHNTHPIHKYITRTNTAGLTKSHSHCITWHPNIFIFVLLCFLPFFSKFVIILNEVDQFTNFMSERKEARSLPEFMAEETIIAKLEQPWWHPVSYSAKWERHIPNYSYNTNIQNHKNVLLLGNNPPPVETHWHLFTYSSYNNAVSSSSFFSTQWHDRIVSKWQTVKDVKGCSCDLIWGNAWHIYRQTKESHEQCHRWAKIWTTAPWIRSNGPRIWYKLNASNMLMQTLTYVHNSPQAYFPRHTQEHTEGHIIHWWLHGQRELRLKRTQTNLETAPPYICITTPARRAAEILSCNCKIPPLLANSSGHRNVSLRTINTTHTVGEVGGADTTSNWP